jgi:hypothetical protein
LEIDREIIQARSFEAISRQFGVSSAAVSHHSHEHLSRQLVQAYQQRELSESMNLLGRIDKILLHAEEIFDRNFKARRDHVALKALGEQRQTIDMLARISMYLHEARAAELQSIHQDQEAQRKTEIEGITRLMLDRLNSAELDIFEKLSEKVQGLRDDDVIPYENPFADLIPVNAFVSQDDPPPKRTR